MPGCSRYDALYVADAVDLIVPWTYIENRQSWGFYGLTFTEGAEYTFLVKAIDVLGHVSDVGESTGQVYDMTPPVVTAAAVVAQREATVAAAWNTQFLSHSDFVMVSCPVCSDLESGVATGTLLLRIG